MGIRVKVSGPKFEFFLLGLGLGYAMFCDVTYVCLKVLSVILIRELAGGPDRNRFLIETAMCLLPIKRSQIKSHLPPLSPSQLRDLLLPTP